MLGRLFHRTTANANAAAPNNSNGSQTSTPETSHQGEEQEEQVTEHVEVIPSSPLIQTDDGKTVAKLYVELLCCADLGPDFSDDGEPVTKTYNPYVKIKLGGNDDKKSLDIHKTKPAQQRFLTRDPIFDIECNQSCFCIDGVNVDDLTQGLMFKVKDAAATISEKKKSLDVLGWALVQPDFLLFGTTGHDMNGMMEDTSASELYKDEVDHTLEFELVHPTQLVTGLAGKIHLICRPATDKEVDECRKKGWGYFQPYTAAPASPNDENMRATTPPLREVL